MTKPQGGMPGRRCVNLGLSGSSSESLDLARGPRHCLVALSTFYRHASLLVSVGAIVMALSSNFGIMVLDLIDGSLDFAVRRCD
ncbi:hypothetical protein KIN20_008124 [Parelaphostrongylus tenuis]|uniref:Uncharacterized protein n=1 Tax=Parelaphostrongylus tenuis TaxID=148309 RepID=A0AAD5M4C1_PARTN|nr:hypothetical protein KIN20_008124 [Parelaphostrongylus tenuis]